MPRVPSGFEVVISTGVLLVGDSLYPCMLVKTACIRGTLSFTVADNVAILTLTHFVAENLFSQIASSRRGYIS